MNVRPVLNAMKELISTSPAAAGDDAGATSGLTQRLQANLNSYRDLLQKSDPQKYRDLQNRILHFKDAYHLTNHDPSMANHTQDAVMPQQQARDTYMEFIPEALSLLLVLDEILCVLHEEDMMLERSANLAAQSSNKAVPRAPKSLLSISDHKTVTGLAQFVVSLGVFPYLSSPLDTLLKMRLSHAKMVEKCSDERVSSDEKMRYLYKMCCVLVHCFGNPVLGPNLLSQHLSDVLVAFLQICYAPREASLTSPKKRTDLNGRSLVELQHHSTPGDVRIKESGADLVTASSLNVCEREWCMDALQRLLSRTYQPLVVRELLAIQQISSIQGPASRGTSLVYACNC